MSLWPASSPYVPQRHQLVQGQASVRTALIERAVRAKFCGRLNKKVCESDFFHALISAKKVAGVTRGDDGCNHKFRGFFLFSFLSLSFRHSHSVLKEDIIRRAGLSFMDAEDVEELEFLLN